MKDTDNSKENTRNVDMDPADSLENIGTDDGNGDRTDNGTDSEAGTGAESRGANGNANGNANGAGDAPDLGGTAAGAETAPDQISGEEAEIGGTAVVKKKKGSEAVAWIRDILIAVLIAVIIAQCIQPTIVREHSMQNTLQPNDYLILSKLSYKFGEIEYGDIVVFKSNVEMQNGKKKLLIKRVIAKGGDTIAIADGNVYRNGELLDEPYTKDGYTNGGLDETVVPEGELFLMGDNRVVSVDSRSKEVGFVSEDLVIGKAVLRLFPFNKIGSLYGDDEESGK